MINILEEIGAIEHGHFLLSSGLHSDLYIEKFRILEKPQVLNTMAKEIARKFQFMDIDYVVGPATGGIIVAYEVARLLGVEAVYVDSTLTGEKALKRGKTLPINKRFLVVDDVLTTGKSVNETISVLSVYNPAWLGIAVLINRGEDIKFDHLFFECVKIQANTYEEEFLPDWLREIPVVKRGTSRNLINL